MNRMLKLPATSVCHMLAGAAVVMGLVSSAAADNGKIEQAFLERSKVSATKLSNPAFNGVFGSDLYDVELKIPTGIDRNSDGPTYRVFQAGEALYRIETPTTTVRLDYFDQLVDPEFRMDADSAERFGRALRAVMPDGFFDDSELEVDVDAVQDHGEAWYFLTGDFFDDYKSFVVSVDGEGRVTEVTYDLKALPKE